MGSHCGGCMSGKDFQSQHAPYIQKSFIWPGGPQKPPALSQKPVGCLAQLGVGFQRVEPYLDDFWYFNNTKKWTALIRVFSKLPASRGRRESPGNAREEGEEQMPRCSYRFRLAVKN